MLVVVGGARAQSGNGWSGRDGRRNRQAAAAGASAQVAPHASRRQQHNATMSGEGSPANGDAGRDDDAPKIEALFLIRFDKKVG